MKKGVSRRDFIKLGASGAIALPLLQSGHAQAMGRAPQPDLPALRKVLGYCPFCQSRCTYWAHVEGNTVRYLEGLEGNRWTGGGMCPKGMSLAELAKSPHRLTQPMLRTESGWKNISYDEATTLVAQKLKEASEKRGKDIYKSLALTAPLWDCRESELAALMLMRLAGGVNVMPPGEVCISTASNTLSTLLGSGNSTTTVDELLNAKVLVLWGANLSETYPPYSRWLDMARAAGCKIIYVDPRKTNTSKWCQSQLFPLPGTDGALALGAVRWIIENRAYDAAYVAASTNNFETLKENAAPWSVEEVCKATGLTPEAVKDFYSTLAASDRTMVWFGGTLSRYSNGMATLRAIIAAQGVKNNLIGSGRGILTMESGKPEGEKEFVDHMCGETDKTGVNFRRLLSAMNSGDIDVLFLNSSYRRYPDCNGVRKAMEKVGFVVYRGFFNTEELDVASLFVPATFGLESQGSHYGAEKQVVWRDKAVDAPGACVPDWQFYRDVGLKFAPDKYPKFETPEELCTLFSNTVPDWKGITVERLRKSPGGLIGPMPEEGGPERPGCIYTEGKFFTADGKLDFAPKIFGAIVWSLPRGNPAGKDADKKFPFTLIQGKIVSQWQQTLTNFAESLAQFATGRFALVHPDTAAKCGVVQGEKAWLETAFGRLEARVEVTERIIPGVVFTPSHFTGTSPFERTRSAPMNTILPNYWDRVSAQFNGLGCTLAKKTGA